MSGLGVGAISADSVASGEPDGSTEAKGTDWASTFVVITKLTRRVEINVPYTCNFLILDNYTIFLLFLVKGKDKLCDII